MIFKRISKDQTGFLTPALLITMIAFGLIAASVGTVVFNNFFIVGNNVKRQQALNIAEAGINYYLWHLNHNGTDYQDGTTGASQDPSWGYGPFIHNYINNDATVSGSYTLYLLPPSANSSVVTVRAIGKVAGSNVSRAVVAQIGATSFANFAVLSDTALWFGQDETANGPVQSNQGVRMDGANSDEVTSANTTYVPPTSLGGNGSTSHPGVWCNTAVTSPVNCNTRSKAAWDYPVTSIDFNQVSSSLCTMKKTAFRSDSSTSSLASQSTACSQVPATRTAAYLPQRSSSYSVSRGYMIELNSDNTYNLYAVNGENDQAANYSNALTLSSVATRVAVPSSGVIYAEDNVWVRTNGNFNGRVSIGSGRLADTNSTNIVIADDLQYAAKDGSDVIGLVSEGDALLAPYAPPTSGSFNFELDAAILAQTGAVQYPDSYRVNANRCTRGWTNSNQTLNFYGSIATRQIWTWTILRASACGDASYDSSVGYISGIEHNTTSYDYNLLSMPPPGFPVTGGFNVLSWREVLTHP